MKRYTTRFLKTVAFIYMAFPVTYLLLVALLFDIPGKQLIRILLAPSFYILSVGAIASGYGLWEMRRWSWYVFFGVNVLVVYSNAILASDYGVTSHKVLAFAIATAIVFFLLYRVSREVRVPYFLPKIRWWESNPRYKLSVPAQLNRPDGTAVTGDILDLSMGGCFVKMRDDLPQDELINLKFTVFGQPIECFGTVVWRTQSTVTHPKGVGVKFGPIPRQQRRALKAITLRLKKIAAFYRSARYLISQEEFVRKLEELQNERISVGKGKITEELEA